MATLDQAVNQMMSADMPPLPSGHPIADGKFHRYGPKRKAWYRLFEYLARNGRRYIHGSFGMWRGADSGSLKIESDGAGMDPAELERLRASQRALAENEEIKAAQRARFAAHRALEQWNAARAAPPDGGCPYLAKKGIEPHNGLRYQQDGTLLVPMIRYDITEEQEKDADYTGPRRLVGLQKIAPDGAKRFNKGMAKAGSACRLGKAPKDGQLILIAEGLATACTLRQACKEQHPVFIAFDAGNLMAVAQILRKLYPKSPMLFCADDDAYLEAQLNKRLRSEEYEAAGVLHMAEFGVKRYAVPRGTLEVDAQWAADDDGVQVMMGMMRLTKPGETEGTAELRTFALQNTGRTKANLTARAVTLARVCWPVFASRTVSPDPDLPRLTDFNDLAVAEGLAAVERQIADAIAMAVWGAGGVPVPKDPAEAGGKGKKGAGGGGDGVAEKDWDKFWAMVGRFTLIYPTDTAYDAERGQLVRVDHMRLAIGRDWVNMWLAAKKRRTVNLEDVVFEPAGNIGEHQLNLFRPLPVKPDPSGSCRKLLDLLQYLCGEADHDAEAPITDWVLKWTAYPLQHPGAKMASALVMWGKEGAGKNLFFGALKRIYGQHGGIITQRQLESQFQLWLSAKLFIIANEVVTRAEMYHNVGFMKHLITEDEIWINRKGKDERCETNHMNIVFFSNESMPLKISPDDRRYMVVKTPGRKPKAYYAEIAAEINAGGIAALYAHLLNLPLGDFNPHTEPIMTQAKADVIEVGMAAPQLFWQDLKDGTLGLPYCPALVMDVYEAFRTWCWRNGHKMPQAINKFTPDFMSMNGIGRARPRLFDPAQAARPIVLDSRHLKLRKVFMMGEPMFNQEEEDKRIQDGVVEFRNALKEYLSAGQGYTRSDSQGDAFGGYRD